MSALVLLAILQSYLCQYFFLSDLKNTQFVDTIPDNELCGQVCMCMCVLLYMYWYVIIGVLVGRWACVGSVELCMCVSVCMRVGYVLRVCKGL